MLEHRRLLVGIVAVTSILLCVTYISVKKGLGPDPLQSDSGMAGEQLSKVVPPAELVQPSAERVSIEPEVKATQQPPQEDLDREVAIPGLLVVDASAATVTGRVWGPGGDVLIRHRIAFAMRGYAPLSSYSGEDGSYSRLLPEGDYNVLYYGAGTSRPVPVIVGELSVLSGERITFDVVVEGSRVLEGNFKVLERLREQLRPGSYPTLLLELRRIWNLDEVISEGSTEIPKWDLLKRLDKDSSEYADEQARLGQFRMENLWPERYTLRIILGEDFEHRLLFLEREVDLRDGDLLLEPELLAYSDFTIHGSK